ncbi:hypothetical protein [Microseira wollei]|uniref:Uncharacterized protein n=1 Tax=Microseira wollei NIES-4236 TaxID=2530354 RepID=A0AAV3X6H7_9CYAN|nr:hypothetical protein [Microseira wollei]GET35954.1 hypothetical protein MiSe_07020 [Microseira wollei NIES-4236]
MMTVNLNNHPIWHQLAEILAQIDVNSLAMHHLKNCNYKVMGYQDEDEFYEEIEFTSPIEAELVSSSLGMTSSLPERSRWITLNFLLKAATSAQESQPISENEIEEIGELSLVFDPNMECIDESWVIYTQSPFVVTKREKDLTQELNPA